MDFIDHPFFRNLMPIAFKNQLELTQNIPCTLCGKSTFTDFELDKICELCHEDIEEVINEFHGEEE